MEIHAQPSHPSAGTNEYMHMAEKWPRFLGGDYLISLSGDEVPCCSQISESLLSVESICYCANSLYLFYTTHGSEYGCSNPG